VPEWILKLVTAITSVKTALKLFVFVLFLVFFWSFTSAFMASKGLPSEYIPYILMLTAYSLSHISIELLYWLKSWNKSRRDKNEESRLHEQAQEAAKKEAQDKALAFRREVESTLPHLEKGHLSLLESMLNDNVALHRRRDPAQHFETTGYILAIGRKSFQEHVYKLHPTVRECLVEYLAKVREQSLIEFSKDLNENQKGFLRIFFEEVIPFGVPEQEEKMPSAMFNTHYSMVTKDIVNKDNNSFTLPEDTRDQLLHDGHFETCFRTVANLDNNFILATASRGGMAIGGSIRR